MFLFAVMPSTIGEGKLVLTDGVKSLEKFAKLPSIEMKKLVMKLMDTKVDRLFPEEEDEEMADI